MSSTSIWLCSGVVSAVLSSSLLCLSPDWSLPSAAASISAVTAGTHPASAAMFSYSILPESESVRVHLRESECIFVWNSKCFLTQAPALSLWISEWFTVTTVAFCPNSLFYVPLLCHLHPRITCNDHTSSRRERNNDGDVTTTTCFFLGSTCPSLFKAKHITENKVRKRGKDKGLWSKRGLNESTRKLNDKKKR